MGKCDGYCRSENLKPQHDEAVAQAVSLLEGRFKEVKEELTAEMETAAEELRFEKAAELRDRYRAIELLGKRQKVVAGSLADTDVVGFFQGEATKSCFVVLHFAGGDLAAKDWELIDTPMAETVLSYAKNAAASGLDGVVCSPLEAGMVHEACGRDFLTVTPGVRFADGDVADQVRVTTPARAREIGSDFIVVGRPITAAPDPVAAYRRCVAEFLGE